MKILIGLRSKSILITRVLGAGALGIVIFNLKAMQYLASSICEDPTAKHYD